MVYYFTIGPLLALVTSTIFGVRTQESNATWAISAKFRNAGAAPVTGISRVPKAVWSVLNEIVEGRLYNNGAPFSQPCFRNGSSATSCSTIQSNYVNNVFRANNYGAYMMVDVRHPLDVMAAFVLSHITSIPLVIKNSGHDYKGRSSTPNGLTLWTHNIRYTTYDPNFQPHTCPSVDATPAITYGAGQDFASLYEFAEANGVTFLGGTDKTVGAAGGWLQGGGHGILSNTLGLGVDRVLQFKVVTPDGILRTANACQNSDLFWALRGGGGGTFGVVLEGTSRVEKKITTQVIYVKFKPVAAHVVAYMQTILENSVKWARDGWGGYADHAIYATPKLSRPEAEASMAPLTQVVASFGSDMLANMFTTYESFLPLFNTVVAAGTAPVGRPFAMATRIIPSTNFITPEGRSTLLNATLSAFNMVGGAAQILATTPYSYNCTSATDVSVTPAWRNAIWHVILAGFWNYNSTAEQQAAVYRTVSTAADKLRVITPGSGAYQNEADVSEPDHENSFWGPNYDRLVAIKKKYDPNGLLDCWHCINWKGAGNERYQCYTQSG